jgi:hypothetical protein
LGDLSGDGELDNELDSGGMLGDVESVIIADKGTRKDVRWVSNGISPGIIKFD